tara:strand:- start:1402 stop:1992 length:591 start_codon:yes stop_codon:yes gene_type:complete
MAERPESIIAPIPPSSSPVLDRFFDYLNQPLRTEDPLKNLLSGITEFVPGISTELARRRGDDLGQALSLLDVLGGSGTGVKMGSIFLIERKKMLEKALKDLDTDPILKMNPDAGKTLQKQLDDVNKQIATDKETAKRYGEMTDEILGSKGTGITSQLPPATLNQLINAVEKQNKIMRKREGDDFVDDFFFGKKPKD